MINFSIKKFSQALSDFIFQNFCPCCNKIISSEEIFCKLCSNTLIEINNPKCPICGIPYEYNLKINHICVSCQKKPPQFLKAISAYEYGGALSKAIINLKYKNREDIADRIGILWQHCASLIPEVDLAIPVPLTKNELKKRKYNQTVLLSKTLLSVLNIPIDLFSLIKIKDIPPQSSLNYSHRLENIKGAFAVKKERQNKVQNKRILLLDDVMTTGATIKECTKILLKVGAKSVVVSTFARNV